jgi:hypothetical protein
LAKTGGVVIKFTFFPREEDWAIETVKCIFVVLRVLEQLSLENQKNHQLTQVA